MSTHHIVVLRIQRVQQTRCTPTAAADHKRLLGRVVRELGAGRLVLLGIVVERTTTGEGDEGDATSDLEETLPERRLEDRGRWWGLDMGERDAVMSEDWQIARRMTKWGGSPSRATLIEEMARQSI